jgi:transcription initiation factor TFIIIB Brf1 subunit/transcription initiation factor TFIIB
MCYEKQYLRGRSQEAIVATCVYMACRTEGSSRTVDGKIENELIEDYQFIFFSFILIEICSISSVSSIEINRTYSKLLKVLPKEFVPPSTTIGDLVVSFDCFFLLD